MKLNKKYLLLRILVFPAKLVFSVIWFCLMGLLVSIKWLKHGGQELYYGQDHGAGLVTLIEQNEKLINLLSDQEKCLENPIKNNRIVNDETFARRLKSHLQGTRGSCAMGEEEIEYLQRVADKLLKYQIETCPKDEQRYHLNCDKELKF